MIDTGYIVIMILCITCTVITVDCGVICLLLFAEQGQMTKKEAASERSFRRLYLYIFIIGLLLTAAMYLLLYCSGKT